MTKRTSEFIDHINVIILMDALLLGEEEAEASLIHYSRDGQSWWCSLEVDEDILLGPTERESLEILGLEDALVVPVNRNLLAEAFLHGFLQVPPLLGSLLLQVCLRPRWLRLHLFPLHRLLSVDRPQLMGFQVEAESSFEL